MAVFRVPRLTIVRLVNVLGIEIKEFLVAHQQRGEALKSLLLSLNFFLFVVSLGGLKTIKDVQLVLLACGNTSCNEEA